VLTKKREEFIPYSKNVVKIYACGITVSGEAHIGHAYQSIVFDVIKKYLEYCGNKVIYVRNYTDVDDKIIARANELGMDPLDYANKFITKTDVELEQLGNDRATVQPRASENINEMIVFIEKLIEKGNAYETERGDVYFSVKTFPEYGKLSNRNVEESINGVRKEVEPGKIDERDFALWKAAKEGEISWDSPWGKGRPGWHIECSAMCIKYLGETIDIHGGGRDLIFPHHENEIAQSEALSGNTFANYWIHNGLININGQKMSKSLGNGISIKELLERHHPDVVRFTLLKNHYRSDINILDGNFEESEEHIYKFYMILDAIDKLNAFGKAESYEDYSELIGQIKQDFEAAMNNDFNTSIVLANLFKYFEKMADLLEKNRVSELFAMKKEIVDLYSILGILQYKPAKVINLLREKHLKKNGITEQEILRLLEERKICKEKKDYQASDMIRERLNTKGISVMDRKSGTEWDIIFEK